MNTWISILFLGTLLIGNGQSKYFPDAFHNVYIGMQRDSLELKRGKVFEQSTAFNGALQYKEVPPRDTVILHTLYLFDQNDQLYEVIIEYRDHFDLYRYMRDLYGEPNLNGEEWVFRLDDGGELYIWQYQNRLCIADGKLYR